MSLNQSSILKQKMNPYINGYSKAAISMASRKGTGVQQRDIHVLRNVIIMLPLALYA